jgi:hypothetical protein
VITAFHDTLNSKLTIVRLLTIYFTIIFIFGKYHFPSIMFWTFFKFQGQNRKNIVLYLFYKPFCRTCLLIALVAALLVL